MSLPGDERGLVSLVVSTPLVPVSAVVTPEWGLFKTRPPSRVSGKQITAAVRSASAAL